MKVTHTFILGWKYKFLAKKQCYDWKSWVTGWRDGRYFLLSRFAKIGNLHVYASVMPPHSLFQPIYTVLQGLPLRKCETRMWMWNVKFQNDDIAYDMCSLSPMERIRVDTRQQLSASENHQKTCDKRWTRNQTLSMFLSILVCCISFPPRTNHQHDKRQMTAVVKRPTRKHIRLNLTMADLAPRNNQPQKIDTDNSYDNIL